MDFQSRISLTDFPTKLVIGSESPKWLTIIKRSDIVKSGADLGLALKSGVGLEAALAKIDALGRRPTTAKSYAARPPEVEEKRDPDFRSHSGSIGPQVGPEGLSTFTVDNSQGEQDVVVRLYRDGNLPALRSFIIKKGDTYTAEKMPPGNYVMRHRNIGSKKTYEANETFKLDETRNETGIRFSRVRVTMYKVRDGNLTNKEVSEDRF